MLQIREYLQNKKNLISLAVLLVLVVAIPLGLFLLKNTQIFRPRADIEGAISLSEGTCVKTVNGVKVLTCKDVPLKLVNPFGSPTASSSAEAYPTISPPPATSASTSASSSPAPSASASPVSSPSPSPSPTACDPKKFDVNTWIKKSTQPCKDGKQKVIYACEKKEKDVEQTCTSTSFNGSPSLKVDLKQRIQNLVIGTVLAADEEDKNDEASGSAKTKCSKKDRKAGTCTQDPNAPNCKDKIDNNANGKIDMADPDCHTDGNAENKNSYEKNLIEVSFTASPSPSASTVSSSSPSPVGSDSGGSTPVSGVLYRLAESETGLAAAAFVGFSQSPTLTTFTLSDQVPGAKQVWVEFKKTATGETRIDHISINMIDINPRVTSADCTLDINKRDVKVTLNGANFGQGSGKISNEGKDLNILQWGENKIAALIEKPGISAADGKNFNFKVTRSDGIEVSEGIFCRVDTSVIALGARVFCRDQGDFDVPNVKVTIKDQNNNKVDETATIAKDGSISGLKTKLQEGKPYILSIKAPNSLRRNAIFTAGTGTTFVSQVDSQPFILPVGDIAPVILNDGKINTLDRSELARQWSVLGKGSGVSSTGDFNKDSRVNSIDWACMRYDFNKSDEDIPDVSILSPTPVPTPVSSTITIPITSPSPSALASQPSTGQRAAYFLPAPEASGSYTLNSQFGVDINIWSQNEAANLFSSQLSFDPTALEVVRIDRGSVLTSWVDDTFDNSAGSISLIAGLPSPGLKTVEGNDPLMAKIIFKGKKVGNTTITMDPDSAVYSNSDNVNIITSLISAPIVIVQ